MNFTNIVIVFLGTLLQSIAVTFIGKKLESKMNKQGIIKLFVSIFIITLLNALVIPNTYIFLFTVTTLIFSLYFILNIKNKNAIIDSILIELVLSISEILVTLIIVGIGLDMEVISKKLIFHLLLNFLISGISIIVIILPFMNKFIMKIREYFQSKRRVYLLYFIIIIIYTLVLKNSFELLNLSTYYLNIFIAIAVLLLFFKIIANELKNETLEEVNKQSMNYIKKYEKIITEQGKTNHEFKNQLVVIKDYAINNPKKLMEYLNLIIEDTKKTKGTYLISQLNKFPDGGIKGLLYYKLSIMEDYKIKYTLYAEDACKIKIKKLSTNQ